MWRKLLLMLQLLLLLLMLQLLLLMLLLFMLMLLLVLLLCLLLQLLLLVEVSLLLILLLLPQLLTREVWLRDAPLPLELRRGLPWMLRLCVAGVGLRVCPCLPNCISHRGSGSRRSEQGVLEHPIVTRPSYNEFRLERGRPC